MARIHHVNIGVQPEGIEELGDFLVEVLGYERVETTEELRARGARWFQATDGSQIHLSGDPEHRPAARAHVALVFGDDLEAVIGRLGARGQAVDVTDGVGGIRVAMCLDPAGNRWELRDRALNVREWALGAPRQYVPTGLLGSRFTPSRQPDAVRPGEYRGQGAPGPTGCSPRSETRSARRAPS